ncbi:3,4-dihydroxy-2-butanone-4-phosphate synthase [Betaproteobacteria bacterium]|nr:3,4-dihydroxy-2-butanone-4-phosphate synthase [Betaproteobacteria bacterium]GHU39947.1 3,4-dihydroxy-2-butanone-4-phosphate synthase [Betaproteobacteria bacterium]
MNTVVPLIAPTASSIAPIKEIIAELKAGRMVILVDEEDRENEGDLVIAAEHVSPEAINFMVTHCRGLVCLTITEARARQLGLAQMTHDNRTPYNTAFTVSIEAAEGVTTGISAFDRARTVQAAVAKNATPDDIVQPGHVFPITAKEGGVLVRAGHTEAGCDLTRLAGLEPSAVICEVLKEDGTMARLPDLLIFAKEHNIKIGAIADLIHYRAASETLVERVASKTIQTAHGEFTLHAYADKASGTAHLALVKGTIPTDAETLVRVHEPLSVLDFLDPGSQRAAFSIEEAEAAIAKNGHGVIVLMHRSEEGSELLERLSAPKPADKADKSHRNLKWDPRTHGIGAQILRDLGVRKMRLLSSPRKIPSMTGFSLEVTGFAASPEALN